MEVLSMVVYKRKKGERFETFLRRFSTGLRKSGKLFKARAKQFREEKMTKKKKKTRTLVGMKLKAKKDYLRKIGKLEDNRK